jgi:cytochrome c oxidase cbb3-type subunit III
MSRTLLLLSIALVLPLGACSQHEAGSAAVTDHLQDRLLVASLTTINNEPALLALVDSLAQSAVDEHCAACHGATLEGGPGVPNLVDYEWIWGISGEETTTTEPIHKIMQTILYGIRDRDCPDEIKTYGACPDTRYSEMPSYSQLGLEEQQLQDLTDYVLYLAGREHDAQALERIGPMTNLCVECHGEGGFGYTPYGGPDLTDDIWLYGGSREEIYVSIAAGRLGYCPPWWDTLNAATIKALAVHIYRRSIGY